MRPLTFALLVPLAAFAQDHSAFYGEWRGQAQYQATIAGNPDLAAHAVTNLTIAIEPGGKISGASTGNGCRLLGLAMPSVMATIMNLDVTLSQCQYAEMNRRFSGTLAHYPKDRYVVLQLQSIKAGIGKTAAGFDIKATMRR